MNASFAPIPAALLVVALALAGSAQAQSGTDSYSGMLSYLSTDTRIDGGALAGANGSIKVNQAAGDLNLEGVDLSEEASAKLFGLDRAGWQAEFANLGEYLAEYGPRLPQVLKDEQQRIASALG